jgi:hypothetical protein
MKDLPVTAKAISHATNLHHYLTVRYHGNGVGESEHEVSDDSNEDDGEEMHGEVLRILVVGRCR